jgi:hypothetical protein
MIGKNGVSMLEDIPRYVGPLLLGEVLEREDNVLTHHEQVLRRIRKLKQQTLYSAFLCDNFQIIKFDHSPKPPQRTPYISSTQTESKHLVETITTSIYKARSILSTDEWDENGFKQFEILCWAVHSALKGPEEDGGFKKLGLLRAWMFFFDLCVTKDFGLRNILRLHLYGLVLAMAPYFPPVCSESLEKFCRISIRRMKRAYEKGASPASELTEIFWKD